MSKTSKRTRNPVDRAITTDVVTQLEVAVRNLHAALIADARAERRIGARIKRGQVHPSR